MLMTGRRCAILRDTCVPTMPSDLVGHIYTATDLADHDASLNEVHRWIRDDLGLGRCGSCPDWAFREPELTEVAQGRPVAGTPSRWRW